MGDIVDSIVRVFEFLTQGILAACVVCFALVWVHPIKRALFEYSRGIFEFVFGNPGDQEKQAHSGTIAQHRAILILVVLLGLLYFLGNLTNVIGYWALEPVHHLAILDANNTPNTASGPIQDEARPAPPNFLQVAYLPVNRTINNISPQVQFAAYADYVREETLWRNCNLEALRHALDPQLKQFRIIRGTIVSSLAICVVALAKGTYFMLISLVWTLFGRSGRVHRLVDWLYEHTVDPSPIAASENKTTRKKQRLRQTLSYATAALTVSGLAFALYLSSLSGWHTVEREYHLMVRFGAESCR